MATPKQYRIQRGDAPAETVGQDTIDFLRTKRMLSDYSVKELEPKEEAKKPAELTEAETADAKPAKSK